MATERLISTGRIGTTARSAAWLLLFGAGYVLTARLSHAVTFQSSYIGLVWAPNAILLSALILAPRKSWWLVIAVSGVAHVLSMSGFTPWWRMAWQIPANGLMAMAAAEAIRRFIGVPVRLERGRDVFIYTGLAIAFPMLLALIAPAFVLAAAGRERLFSPGIAYLRIALANIPPILLVTPAVVLWARLGTEAWSGVSRRRRIEAAVIIGSVVVTGVFAFGAGPDLASYPWVLLLTFPPLIWAAVRLGPTGASTSLLCVAALSVWGATGNAGPFVAAANNDVVLSLLVYWIVIGPPVMLLAAVIREREAAEASLHEQRSQLAHLMRTATAGQLSTEMAHELRQPMQAIMSNASAGLRLLGRERTDLLQLRELFEEIVQQDQEASRIIARLQSAVMGGAPKLEPLALDLVVVNALALTRHAAARARVDVQAQVPSSLPRVRGDASQLLQVVVNLVVNACESMIELPDADRVLRLRVGRAGPDRLDLSVADSGVGIPAQAHDQVFEPFFTTKDAGLGLGLSISRSIAVAHGGRLWAKNNDDDRGATFHLELPTDLAQGEALAASAP